MGNILWSKLPEAERAIAQAKVLDTLILATEDGEWVVRYAAIVGLESLSKTLSNSRPELIVKVLKRFEELLEQEAETAICARIQYAMTREQLII